MKRDGQPVPEKCVYVKRDGERCGLSPIKGGTVCHKHGGRAPQVKRGAARNLTIKRAQRMVQLAGVDQDPIEHLLDSLHRAATLVHVWGMMAATLDDAGGEWASRTGELRGSLHYTEPSDRDRAKTGAVLQVTSNEPLLGFSQSGEARIHPFVVQYEQALERRAKFAKMCLDAGVAERQVRMVERAAEQLSSLFEQALAAIEGLSAQQRAAAAAAYAKGLARLEAPIEVTARSAA